MSEIPLRFAVIGCGRMGRVRMRTTSAHPEARLVAVMDTDAAKAREAAADHGVPWYTHLEQIAAREDIDVVYVSVPNKWHADVVQTMAVAGKHIFTEKPLARTVDEATVMVETVERYGVTLKVGANLRYFPNVLKARELIDRSCIGRVLFSRCWIGHQGWNEDTWYRNPEIAGGGTFLDNGSHVLDLSRWFLGEVKSCIGYLQNSFHNIGGVEDNGYGVFEMCTGAMAMVQASWTEWAGYMYMEIYGSEGYIRIDNRGTTCSTTLGDCKGQEQVFDFSAFPPGSYKAELAAYVEALRTGRPPVPNGYDGLRVVAMATGVYESARTARRVGLLRHEDCGSLCNSARHAGVV